MNISPTQNHRSKNWRSRFKKIQGKLHEQLDTNDDQVSLFEWITVFVIVISSLSIGAKTYILPPTATLTLEILEKVVIVYFLVEILARWGSADSNRNFFTSGWNLFDTLIVIASLLPLPDSEYVLLGRLLRLLRVMRLFTFLPHLRVLLSSLLLAIPKVAHVVLLMFIIFYIYGAFGSLMFNQINPELWGNIGSAMITMFRIATLDWAEVMYETGEVYPMSWMFYISFILLVTFVMLNMIVGIIVDTMKTKTEPIKTRKTENSVNGITT